MGGRLCFILALTTASAHVCIPTTRGQSALRRAPCVNNEVTMIFGQNKGNMETDLTDLGPLTKEKRAVYKADRTPKTAYVPDNLAWDGSGLYVLMLPFLVVVALSLFGGVNLFGYSSE